MIMKPSVFDLYKLQQFVYTLPQNSQLLQHIDYALKMINFYRIQYMSLSDLTNFIENDKEPYSQFYHPAVHAARSFISISDYILTESVDQSMSEEVMNKLENTRYCFRIVLNIVLFIVMVNVIHLQLF